MVRVLLFARYREIVGVSHLSVDLPPDSRVSDLFNALAAQHPVLEEMRPYTTFAVNREVVDGATVLHPGDEVAFLQPVSGGMHD